MRVPQTTAPTLRTAPAMRVAIGSAIAVGICLLGADTASAAENLQLLPDWTGKLPLLILLFVVLMFPANALLFRPIFRILDEREERTDGTRRRAAQIAADAEQTLAKYREAVRAVREQSEADRKRQIAEARSENSALTARARGEAESEIERARRELADALEESRSVLRAQAESIAAEAATRVLGRPL